MDQQRPRRHCEGRHCEATKGSRQGRTNHRRRTARHSSGQPRYQNGWSEAKHLTLLGGRAAVGVHWTSIKSVGVGVRCVMTCNREKQEAKQLQPKVQQTERQLALAGWGNPCVLHIFFGGFAGAARMSPSGSLLALSLYLLFGVMRLGRWSCVTVVKKNTLLLKLTRLPWGVILVTASMCATKRWNVFFDLRVFDWARKGNNATTGHLLINDDRFSFRTGMWKSGEEISSSTTERERGAREPPEQ